MADFLNIYTLDPQTGLKKTAVLQNAFSITETQELNKIYMLDFSIPATDEKTKFILPFHYVRYGDKGQLYRIIKINFEDSDKSILNVSCEHVIAMLCDELMFGSVQYGGGTIKTAEVIRYLLDQQTTRNWDLNECDFDRKFEYLWEQENILNALYSIPREFTKAYKWVFDTAGYPWKLSLKIINAAAAPEYYIRAKRNLLSSGTDQDYTGVCTRIYPLGYGEGVNQLTIKDALVDKRTGEVDTEKGEKWGQTFIESPAEILAQYGIKEKVLVDRRFENAESLYTYGKTMLEGLQTPSMSRSFDVLDLYPLTNQAIDSAEVGKICRMTGDGTTAYITKTVRVLDDPGNLQIELSTKATDLASTIADLADRVRIESVYAQGATQLYQHSKDANATPTKGMVISLYFPAEMRQINKVLLRLKLEKFRSYSEATDLRGNFKHTYTIKDESKEITSQTNTENKELTIRDESKEITSQTNTEDKEVKIQLDPKQSEGMTAENEDQNLNTTKGGGGVGETSTDGGGTINVTLSGSASETGDANWSSGVNPYTENTELDVSISTSNSTHSHTLQGRVATVEPASQTHKHTHYFTENGSPVGYISGDGSHNHSASIVNPEGEDGHHHVVKRSSLKHTHSLDIDITSNVEGQVGFAHSHKFHIGEHDHAINIAHKHLYDINHTHTFACPSHKHAITIPGHTHKFACPSHKHAITIPGHTHKFACPSHKHAITIPGHTHTIEIPEHSHNVITGIFESGNPKAFSIFVDNTLKETINDVSYNNDITSWLLDAQRQIPRDTWINIEIRPDDLAYVQSSVFVQGFVQSRGGGNF